MIKWIKKLLGKIFKKKEAPLRLEIKPDSIVCTKHLRFRKSCMICRQAAAEGV